MTTPLTQRASQQLRSAAQVSGARFADRVVMSAWPKRPGTRKRGAWALWFLYDCPCRLSFARTPAWSEGQRLLAVLSAGLAPTMVALTACQGPRVKTWSIRSSSVGCGLSRFAASQQV
jgi:hypothetical protein